MGLSVFDAGVLIGFLDANDAHHEAARVALHAARGRGDQLVLPASALAEILVGPSRSGQQAIDSVRRFVDRIPFRVVALDADIATIAAGLRARHQRLKLPDAVVIATAVHLDADHLVTTDRGWPPRTTLKIRTSITEI